MNLFFVSLMLLFKTVYTLEAVDFKDAKNRLENIQEKPIFSNNVKQTESLNNYSQKLNNIHVPTVNNINNTTEKYVDYSDLLIDISKTISSKVAEILKMEFKYLLNKYISKEYTDEKKLKSIRENAKSSGLMPNMENFDKTSEKTYSASEAVLDTDLSKKMAESRHFVFHPYLPYGKETAPDEKISIHDVLPIKMVKFIKSMVEDAPWEQMFMKMVRMVVDQFVDKIIEKMFSHKEEEDKWRSMKDEGTSSWSALKKSLTSVIRLRRSISESKAQKDSSWDSSSFSQSNRLSKNDDPKVKETSESESWLDSVLDFLFPEGESDVLPIEYSQGERRKRDIDLTKAIKQVRMEDIIHTFLMKYLDLSDGKTSPEEVQQMVQNFNPSQGVSESDNPIEEISPQKEPEKSKEDQQSNSVLPKRWSKLLLTDSSEILTRAKRNVHGKEAKRLWQGSQRSRPSSLKSRDECSLRKACNAGRLLSRLPSVKDLTLQLKEYANEPHWDALLWGMSKKRCSKIFCKRQRSPKGSIHSWSSNPEERLFKKHTASTTHKYRTHKTHPKALFTV